MGFFSRSSKMTKQAVVLISACYTIIGCDPYQAKVLNHNTGKQTIGSLKATDFYDTGANNSLVQDDQVFEFVKLPSGESALMTKSTATNIHSHLNIDYKFSNFTFSGRMMFTDDRAGLGVSFLSQFPNQDAYYRVRRYEKQKNFHFEHHASSACRGLGTSFETLANRWYDFVIKTSVTATATSFEVQVTEVGDASKTSRLVCTDSSATRFQTGTVGVWAMGPGTKYWTQFSLSFDPFSDGPVQDVVSEDPAPIIDDPAPPVTEEPVEDPVVEAPVESEPVDISAPQIQVANATQLQQALLNARGGEIINLASGTYGALTIRDRSFSKMLTIRSADGKRGARLGNVQILNSSYVRLQNLHVAGSGTQAVFVDKGSHHIDILDSDIHGPEYNRSAPSYEQATLRYTVRLYGGSHHIRLEGNTNRDAINGPTSFGVSNLTIKNNFCDWVASDCFKFGNVDQLLFEGNIGARNIYSSPDAHVDYVQAQGIVTNAILRNNIAIMGTRSFQGLFFGSDEPHENVLLENNLILNSHIRAISFNSNSKNITARNNTVLTDPRQSGSVASIIGVQVKENNIEAGKVGAAGWTGSNLRLQYEDRSKPFHYSALFANAMKSGGWTLEDLRPLSSGPGACGSGLGAEDLICSLLNLNK